MPSIEVKINSKEKTPEEKAKEKKIIHTILAVIFYALAIVNGFCFFVLRMAENRDTTIAPQLIFGALCLVFGTVGSEFWKKDHKKKLKN